jgi:hypothetical protein
MPTKTPIIDFLINLLVEDYGIKSGKITLASRISEDFRLDGDDAVEFFDSFHEAFPFDPGTFTYDTYFNAEGFSLGFFDWIKGKKKPPLRPMTLQMLVDAAMTGRWQDNQE